MRAAEAKLPEKARDGSRSHATPFLWRTGAAAKQSGNSQKHQAVSRSVAEIRHVTTLDRHLPGSISFWE
jgi:hypothetical protein